MQKYLEIGGRTFYAFEEPDFVGPLACKSLIKVKDTLPSLDAYETKRNQPGFWRRQLGQTATAPQVVFDWTFGVIMPAACFFFDPIVFRSWDDNEGFLSAYRIFAYLMSGISIMGLAAWLLWGERLKSAGAPLAGLFFAGGIVSGIIGLVLLPLSVLGAAFLIGLLGFTPLFTSLVFLRNARRTYGMTSSDNDRTLGYIAMLSGIAAVAIPWLINTLVATESTRRGFYW